jgi:hypothetical protein
MNVGIVGSRRRQDRVAVIAFVKSLPDSVVVSGGCPNSVDTWATAAARARGLDVIEHLPRPDGPGRLAFTKACYARNELIALDSHVLIAFIAPDRVGHLRILRKATDRFPVQTRAPDE